MRCCALRTLTAGLLLILSVTARGAQREATDGRAELIGSYTWHLADPRFGGFSALEVDADGIGFTALSDSARILAGRFRRDAQGRIAGVEPGAFVDLHGRNGRPLTGAAADSEGLAIAADGTIYVSFELWDRVGRYRQAGGPDLGLPRAADWDRYATNFAFESLAIDAAGRLYTMPEHSAGLWQPFPVYRYDHGRWHQPFTLPRRDAFVPVGADFGPDGRFYLLERQFTSPFGFRSRVRRFDLTDDGFADPEVLVDTATGAFDNLEGLSVWRDAEGAIRLTLISDDNFFFLQRTQIVEFRVP
jgi:hypothetical protein